MIDTNVIFKGSNDVELSFALSNVDGVLSLLEATVTLIIAKDDGTEVERTCDVDSASGGLCSYTLVSTDIPTAGRYQHQLKVVYDDGRVFYGQMQYFDVVDTLTGVIT